jgi:hypothetical protein
MDKYTNSQQSPNIMDSEYFSGSQASVYFGDVWVDEINSFHFEAQQAKTPIFGYASQLFDAVARGPLFVRGTFTLNFKESGYLFLILNHLKEMEGKANPFFSSGTESNDPYRKSLAGNNLPLDGSIFTQRNIEQILDQSYASYAEGQRFNSTGNFASIGQEGRLRGGNDKAEDKYEKFENEIWRDPALGTDASLGLRRVDDHRINGFDIFISFGDFTNNFANHTIIKILNVHLLGPRMVLNPDGRPILEEYPFFARNIV